MKLHNSVFFLLLFISLPLSAQEPAHTYLGILGNYEYGSPTTMNRDAGVIQTFGTQGVGISWDNSFGLSFYVQKPQFFSEKLGLSFLSGYSSSVGEFKSNYFQAPIDVKDFRVISKTKKIGIEGFISYAISSNFFTETGVWGNYRISNDITQHLEGIDPPGKDTIIAYGEAISTSKFHYGIPVIFGGRFPLSDLLSVNVEGYGKIDLGETFRGYGKQALSFGIRLGISFSTNPTSLPDPLPQTIPEPVILLTSVHFTTNGRSIKTIIAHPVDTITTFYQMLPSKIYFDAGADLPRSFALFDIIGKRMRDMPESELHISSLYSSSEPEELTIRRTRQIEKYLDTIWKIPQTRMQKSAVHSMQLSYCELSDNSKILSPMVDEITERSLAVSPISLSRFISSQAGVRSWKATIRDESTTIASFSSEDFALGDNPVQILPVNDKVLFAKLHTIDNSGQIREAYDTLEIKVADGAALQSISRRDVFLLLPDSSENSMKWIIPLKEKILQLVSEKSIVRFQPLYLEGAKTIQFITGRLLSQLQLNPAAKIEIITAAHQIGKDNQLWQDEKDAFIVTIFN